LGKKRTLLIETGPGTHLGILPGHSTVQNSTVQYCTKPYFRVKTSYRDPLPVP